MTFSYQREFTIGRGRPAAPEVVIHIQPATHAARRIWRLDVDAEWFPPGTITLYSMEFSGDMAKVLDAADELAAAAFETYGKLAAVADGFRDAALAAGLN